MKTIFKGIISLLVILLSSQISSAQDWAQLEHFKEANAELSAPEPSENRVVFMGNSITIGWLHHHPEFFEGKPYVNRGISGQTTPQMLLRFQQDVIALQPKVVVILAGTNDIAGNTGPMSLEQILDNIKSMTQLAQANDIKVVLASVLPAFDYPWRTGLNPDKKIPALNEMIEAFAEAAEVEYLDYFSAMTDGKNGMMSDLGHDGVHPNKKGYQLMAPLAEKAILSAIENQ